jgi:Multivesicular body subunit 12
MLLYRNINNQGNYFNIRRSPMLNLMDLKSLYSGLPDDRPITSIGVIEDSDKCPPDYYVVRHWKHLFFLPFYERSSVSRKTFCCAALQKHTRDLLCLFEQCPRAEWDE